MWPLIFLTLIVIVIFIAVSESSETVGNWSHLFDNMEYDPEEFYALVEEILEEREIPDYSTQQREFKEGGLFSYYRLYLEVSRKDYTYHICAAPWGQGFFFSWWLRKRIPGVTKLPFIGKFFKERANYTTYYKADTDAMFRASVQQSVQEAMDRLTESAEMPNLTELERKPDLRSMIN